MEQFEQQMELHKNNKGNKMINKANTRKPPEESW